MHHSDCLLPVCDIIDLNRKFTNRTAVQCDKSKREQIISQRGCKMLPYWRSLPLLLLDFT
jgi:hypothetical protein